MTLATDHISKPSALAPLKQQGWCILRTSGGRTLPLVKSLTDAGFEAWTPTGTAMRRRGPRRKQEEVAAPILPTFAFLREDRLADIVRMLSRPTHAHPPFSIFLYDGRVPIIGDRSMQHLRAEEARMQRLAEERAKAAASKQRHHIPVGQSVTVKDEANFLGLTGVVEACDGRKARVNFGGIYSIDIDTWRLVPDSLQAGSAPG